MPGALGMQIRPEDRGAWIAAWGLSIDDEGQEFGWPCKLPRGQLGHYLAKKRMDGGKRFSMQIPKRVQGPKKFHCFVKDCTKPVDERIKLVYHIEAYHPQEAMMYREQLDRIRQAVIRDNKRLDAIISDLEDAADGNIVSVPRSVQEAQARLPMEPVAEEQPVSLSGFEPTQPIVAELPAIFRCEVEGCTRFFDSAAGLKVHVYNGHKGGA